LGRLFNGYEKKEEINVSTVEKTIFDCFLKPRLVGYSNITKATYSSQIDWKKFLRYYRQTKNNALYQRTGYILELMNKEMLHVPDEVFRFLLNRVKKPVKLLSLRGKSVYNKKWKVQDNIGRKNMLSWRY